MNQIVQNSVVETFYEAFLTYHAAIWPMVAITYLMGIAAVILAIKKPSIPIKQFLPSWPFYGCGRELSYL